MNRSIPRVSILLPNLNHRPFLEERLQSILGQTFSDWELVIVDNHSDDGAWEFFKNLPARDSRIRIFQAPRKGMYDNWNNCIRLARGEFVYIATSDDTMSPDFLEIMVKALSAHPECELAHCKLRIITENGDPHPTLAWDKFFFNNYLGDLVEKKHIRFAPHDGVLHCGVKTVYTSITQLLIRRSLFDRVGLFLTAYGSIADFEWDMRASLVANTLHIPEYLATWRVHREQGTNLDFLNSAAYRTQLLRFIDHAFKAARKVNPALLRGIREKELKNLYLKEKLVFEIREQRQKAKTELYKYKIACKWLFLNPGILREYMRFQASKSKPGDPARSFITPWEPMNFSRKILAKYGLENNYKIIDG
jgi:glycosyltransferase involved in cell wall biosynthesis